MIAVESTTTPEVRGGIAVESALAAFGTKSAPHLFGSPYTAHEHAIIARLAAELAEFTPDPPMDAVALEAPAAG